MTSQTGRNDPCPCGSGKKYKKCCLIDDQKINPARELSEELQDLMQDQEFSSIEEANEFAGRYMEKRNSAPIREFHGLSSHAMHRLLHFPFESPEIVRFNFSAAVTSFRDAPLLQLLSLMVDALGETGIKPTATGNLPRATSREIARHYFSPEKYAYLTKYHEFMGENEVPDLMEVRRIAELAGFIKKYRGKLIVSKSCRQLVASDSWSELYETLFKVLVHEYDLAYRSKFQEIPFLKQSFAFTMFLLSKYGNEPRPGDFYGNTFIEAFPVLYSGVRADELEGVKSILCSCYISQVLYTFAEIAGFIDYGYRIGERAVTVLPLLGRLVSFDRI